MEVTVPDGLVSGQKFRVMPPAQSLVTADAVPLTGHAGVATSIELAPTEVPKWLTNCFVL